MSGQVELPPYFIEFDHALPMGRWASGCTGAMGDIDLLWQVRDSVRELIAAPVIISPAIKEGEPIPDAMLHNEVLIVSDRLREAIEPWLKDYEFFPAKVELWDDLTYTPHGGGRQIEGFWWLNSWRRLDIVDWEKTEASRYGPFHRDSNYRHSPLKATAWQRLALAGSISEGEHFFGLAGFRGEHRYLSAQLHAHLAEQPFRIRFQPKLLVWGSMPDGGPEAFEEALNPHMPRPMAIL